MELRFELEGRGGAPFQVPEEDLLGPYRPHHGSPHAIEPLVEQALEDPLGIGTLESAARHADRLLLLIDDATRKTPVAKLLPPLARRLDEAGMADDQVTILVAPGTHRTMTRHELEQKLGPFVDRWNVEQHDHRDEGQLVRLGTTADGMPIEVNRRLPEHDLVIGIGSVGVHGIMGYSGGAKIAMIGAGGPRTETWTHWLAATRYETHELLGVVDNPLRRNLEEGARIAGLDAVLNVAVDCDGSVQATAYGDPVMVHRALVPAVQRNSAADIPRPADVVVVDAYPAVRDFWQSVKGLYAADLVVRDGGAIILVAANPEGVADHHPNVLDLAGESFPEIVHRVENGAVRDVIGAAVAAYTARLRRRAHIHLVSDGITDHQARALGFTPARSVQDALDACSTALGPRPRTAVLERAGMLLPVVAERNADLVSLAPISDHGSRA